jgi:exoribonuclease-2
MPDGPTKILVAVADVDAVVRNGSALDGHAKHNTTSVYTDARCQGHLGPQIPSSG